MLISLRESWQSGPYPPIDETRPEKFDGITPVLHVKVELPRRLRPLSEGMRASSSIERKDGNLGLAFASVRRMISSFGWWTPQTLKRKDPEPFDIHKVRPDPFRIDEITPFTIEGGLSAIDIYGQLVAPMVGDSLDEEVFEIQGAAFREKIGDTPALAFIISTSVVWVMQRDADDWIAKDFDGPPGLLFLPFADGPKYFGKRMLSRAAVKHELGPGPVHMSAPSMYNGLLLVPAEGDPYPAGEAPGVPGDDKRRFSWVWGIDPNNLGLACRIALPADEPSESLGMGSHFSGCAADPETGLLWAVRYGDDRPLDCIYLFRLPDLSAFDSRNADYIRGLAPENHSIDVPVLLGEYVGRFLIYDEDATPLGLGHVNGVAVAPNGHIYVNLRHKRGGTSGEDVGNTVMGFDPLTGRAVRVVGTGSLEKDEVLVDLASDGDMQGMFVDGMDLVLTVWHPTGDTSTGTYQLIALRPRDGTSV